MKEYRISKYDPKFRDKNGVYKREEWTSFHDIGKRIGGEILTEAEYLRVERQYVDFLLALLAKLGIDRLKLSKQEPRREYRVAKIKVSDESFRELLKRNLREDFWCEFHGAGIGFWMGYEYYLHISSKSDISELINELAAQHGLFAEDITL